MALVDVQNGPLMVGQFGPAVAVGGIVIQAANFLYDMWNMKRMEEVTQNVRDVQQNIGEVQAAQDATQSTVEKASEAQRANNEAQHGQHEATHKHLESLENKLKQLESIPLDWSKPWMELLGDLWHKFVDAALYLGLAILQICSPLVGMIIKGGIKFTVFMFKMTARLVQILCSAIKRCVIKIYRLCKAVRFIVKNNARLINAIDEHMNEIHHLTKELKELKQEVEGLRAENKDKAPKKVHQRHAEIEKKVHQRPAEIDEILRKI